MTPVMTEPGLSAPRAVAPRHLSPGDVVELEGERFEVVGTPFIGCAGSSVFDEYGLFWRVCMRPLRDTAERVYGTWAAGQRVSVVR